MKKLSAFKARADALEDGLLGFLYKARLPLFVVVVSLLAFWARVQFWPFISGDFAVHLDVWLNEIRAQHGFHSIGGQVGNYTPLYHYLLAAFTYIPGLDNLAVIKITSTIADFFLAGASALVVLQLTSSRWKGALGYALVLCLPTVFLNSAAWGQCDAMYTTFLMLTLLFWLRDKKLPSMVMYGLALAIKLQAVYLLPALVIFWLCGRLRLRQLLIILPVYVATCLPAMIAEGNANRLLLAVTQQTKVHTLTANLHNAMELFSGFTQEEVYQIVPALTIFALLAVGLVAFYCWNKRDSFDRDSELLVILLMLALVPYLLPGMRERYFFPAEVMLAIYVLYRPARLLLPLIFQLSSLSSYLYYLTGAPNTFGGWLMVLTALPAIVLSWDLYRRLRGPGQVTPAAQPVATPAGTGALPDEE